MYKSIILQVYTYQHQWFQIYALICQPILISSFYFKQKSHFHIPRCKCPAASSDSSDPPSVATLSPHTSEVAQHAGCNPSCEEVTVKGKYPYSRGVSYTYTHTHPYPCNECNWDSEAIERHYNWPHHCELLNGMVTQEASCWSRYICFEHFADTKGQPGEEQRWESAAVFFQFSFGTVKKDKWTMLSNKQFMLPFSLCCRLIFTLQ